MHAGGMCLGACFGLDRRGLAYGPGAELQQPERCVKKQADQVRGQARAKFGDQRERDSDERNSKRESQR